MPYLLAALIAAASLATAATPAKKIKCDKDLKKARELIEERWSFKIFKPGYVDLDATYRELAPEAKRADTPEACADVLARFMARLGDGHSRLAYFPDVKRTRPKITIRSQRERLTKLPGMLPAIHAYVVARDTTDEALRTILPGSEILAVDGKPVDSLYAYLSERAAGSTQQWRDYLSDERLLLGPPDTDIEITIREPGGAKKMVTVHRPPYPTDEEREREREIYRDTARVAVWKILDGGWGYLRYKSFSYPGYDENLKLFDAALDSLMETPGLIIDLRGNGGGIVAVMTATAGRFVTEKFALEYFQLRHPGQTAVLSVWDPFSGSYTVRPPWVAKPREKTYAGPVVILIDRRCFSACEGFTGGLQSIKRALVIGETSGGGSGAVSGLKLPSGAIITFSFTVGWRPDGTQVEGQGVSPDIPVKERPRDWAVGRDRVLERAIRALERGEAKPLIVAETES
jgi:C-terminal processing protease CtpA/Prc